MKQNYLIIFLVLFFVLSLKTRSQETSQNKIPKRIYTTKPLLKVPVIDGDVSDDAWNVVEWSSDFTQKEPDEGKPPTHQTLFKVMYDKKYLYVAIRALDAEPDLTQRRLSRRDGFQGDRVNVIIDSYHDKRTAFVFTTTAAGVKGEEFASQNGDNWDDSWNPIWYTNAKIDGKGWTAEMKIPFSQLRFGKAEEQIWGFNVNRTIFRLQERSLWQRIPNDQAGFISEAGELHGLKNLVSQKQLEIQPFTVLKYDKYPEEVGNPYRTGKDFKFNAGLDAKIGITNDLTLDLTVNPDFGQVEADPGAIALDGFQIFFEEQRPFFVENSNIFDYEFANGSDNLFYSRRIGRNPHRSANLLTGEYANEPQNSRILGAAKFSGKTREGWSIGVLESVTGNEFAEIKQTDGNTREEIVEPLTNYFVTRVQKDFNDRNSFIGGIFTATNRHLNNSFNELHKAAYTGGIDFQHNWKNREYFLDGNVIFSRVLGSKEAITATQQTLRHNFQRTDASHVAVDFNKTSLSGSGGRIEMGKNGGGNWRYNGGVIWRSPELELNDVGFLRRTDEIIQFGNLSHLWQVPTETYRNIRARFEQSTYYDFAGNLNRVRFELNGEVSWINNWWTEAGYGISTNYFDNFYLRGGPRFKRPNTGFWYLFFGSNQSKLFSFTLGYSNRHTSENVVSRDRFVIRTNYQATDALSMSLNIEYANLYDKTQYVSETNFNNNPRYILGKIQNQTLSTTLRINYSFTPDISLQFYGQPFISKGTFSDLNQVINPLGSSINDRIAVFDNNQITFNNDVYLIDENRDGATDYSFDNPNFSFVQLQTNLVARWEYISGSELFLVWSRGSTGNAAISEDLVDAVSEQVFHAPANDTFLVKFTYRFRR
ncbi:hydrolase [Polaribacter reichenbachii]|uniref:Hydrolase n=1 Tax=Polaribacter reichenbachii TaxID=996801 RepID=A0A1B8TVP9_9FLAO|nr:DUF5916 domain-containing protein [Polaribacter reichenbachii]APZ45429.1 hydrolase [Polaribacter reichenbachii]AUC19290.1 hydrolase [Polaribacter reichenbachii]OBY63555.1 hydrolase [Polaribacter reichenbachii]